jgi:hypothetical protein
VVICCRAVHEATNSHLVASCARRTAPFAIVLLGMKACWLYQHAYILSELMQLTLDPFEKERICARRHMAVCSRRCRDVLKARPQRTRVGMLLARLLTSSNPQRSLTDTDGIYCTMHRPSTPSVVFLHTSTFVAHARKSGNQFVRKTVRPSIVY